MFMKYTIGKNIEVWKHDTVKMWKKSSNINSKIESNLIKIISKVQDYKYW